MTLVVAMGDSIAAGQGLPAGEAAWPARITGFDVLARGVPGDTTRLALERFPADVQASGAQIVVIAFGHNDANRWETDRGVPRVSPLAFEGNLAEMVKRVRTFDAQPYLATLTPTFRSERHAADCADYDMVIRSVADWTDTPLIDVAAAFGGRDLTLDGLHLDAEGHALYAACVQEALAR